MATAYTPGLKVSPFTVVRRTRRLPIKGEVLARPGDAVAPDSVVARANIPGILRTVRASERLGVDADEMPGLVKVREGEPVEKGRLLAESRSFWGLFKSEVHAPVDGVVEIISPVTGHISIREQPNPVEVQAYIEGTVVEVTEGEGAVVETRGALIQGIFGVGGERLGPIRMAVESPDAPITEHAILPYMTGHVIAGGSNISAAGLQKAVETGVVGIVVGAIIDQDLVDFLGYDIGVAITGHEAIPLTLILTEGFGTIPMAERTFRLLKELEFQQASINGATQIRAGVIRPEVIVPRESGGRNAQGTEGELAIGRPIRIIREPYFGELATVVGLPPELTEIPSGAHVRVLHAKLSTGRTVVVPRANVELIEE